MKPISSNQYSVVKEGHQLISFLSKKGQSISPLLILTHDYPDPDSLASAYALKVLAEQGFGIQSKISYGGIIGRMENRTMVNILKLPIHKLTPSDFKRFEHVALLDTQPSFHNNSFPKDRRATIVIDQHPSAVAPASEFSIVDPNCAATSVILAQALLSMKIDIHDTVATALVYGILTDTLNLYREDKPIVTQTYLKLLPYCNMKELAKIQNPPRSRKFFSTLSRGILNAMVSRRLIVSHLGTVDTPDLVSQTADFLLTYKGMLWAFCTGRFKSKLHVSLRAESPNTDAGEILRDIFDNKNQAGGHGTIGGGSIEVGLNATDEMWQEKEKLLVERLQKRVRVALKKEFYYPFR